MKWLPIETAPKDGTHVLVFIGNPKHPGVSVYEVWWDTTCYSWVDDTEWRGLRYVTHWMPLPDPPTDQGGDA